MPPPLTIALKSPKMCLGAPSPNKCLGRRYVHRGPVGGFGLRSFAMFVLVVLMIMAIKAKAQVATAEIRGTIHDPQSAVVPGAEVTVTQADTGFSTKVTTDASGLFDFPTLPVGSYTVSVSSSGFEGYLQTGVQVTVGQHLELGIELKVGASTEQVTVSAAAVAVDSTTATVQSTIEQKVVEDLPLNGRNPATLMFTVAGVADAGENITTANTNSTVKAADASGPQESAPSVHGARPGGTYFSLDGANNTDPFSVIGGPFPNPDATGQFSVVTGTYGAQYVSAPGGAINIVSRSGTNNIHGTVFEFIRNGYFNARNYFSTQPDVLKRNQFGFAIGAPLLRDKLFVFGTYQATPTTNSLTSVATFPTEAQRGGNFGTFQIPPYLLSPLTQEILKYIPLGDPTTGLFSYQTPSDSNEQQGLVKFDLNLGKHLLFARAFYDRYTKAASGATPSALLASLGNGYIQPWMSFAIGDTWSPGKWTLQTTGSFIRALSDTTINPGPLSYSNLGITNLSGYPQNPSLSLLLVNGAFSVGTGSVEQFPRAEFELSQNAFVTKGKHQLSFGVNYRHISLNESNYSGENPIALYYGVNSYIYGLIGLIPGATLNPLSDFILGAPYIFYQQDGFFSHLSGNLFGVYAEDNVQLSNKLTLTGGLRWDPDFAYTPKGGRITCFVPGAQSKVFVNALPGLLFPGDPGCSSSGTSDRIAEFQPRIGLAYAVNPKMAVRAGYGLYDLQVPLNSYIGFSAQPWVRTYEFVQPGISIDNVWGSLNTPNPFASGFQQANYVPPANTPFTTGLQASTFDRQFRPAYVQQWSLSVQQLLSSKDSVDMAYIGTQGVHLSMGASLNTPVYGPGANQTNEQERRPYTDYGNITSLSSIGTSSYNGVDVTYRHRENNYTITSAFTWSKALDDLSSAAQAGTINIPNGDAGFFRGRSSFDQNLVFRTTGTANGPKFSDSNLFVRSALGLWSFSGLAIIDAGQPFSVTDGSDNSYTGLSLDLADRVPNVPVYVNGKLNINAFTNNAPGTFGNSGRNAYRGASYKDLDLAAIKTIPIKESIGVTFRAEAFNIFNHPNFLTPPQGFPYGPPGTPAGETFGEYLIARDPRILQFSLKVSF